MKVHVLKSVIWIKSWSSRASLWQKGLTQPVTAHPTSPQLNCIRKALTLGVRKNSNNGFCWIPRFNSFNLKHQQYQDCMNYLQTLTSYFHMRIAKCCSVCVFVFVFAHFLHRRGRREHLSEKKKTNFDVIFFSPYQFCKIWTWAFNSWSWKLKSTDW